MLPEIFSSIDLVFWDWNGTLIDDLELCRMIINESLEKRSMPAVSRERYLEIFQFPVGNYYNALGFDLQVESFAQVGKEFIDAYASRMLHCPLHNYSRQALELLQRDGKRQCVLSALQKDSLEKVLAKFSLSSFFDIVRGLDDHLAHGKIELGRALIADANAALDRTILIGDTVHDFETADALGIKCVLVAAGHNSRLRLEKCGVPVFDSLQELFSLV